MRLLPLLPLILTAGCFGGRAYAKLVDALARDPATVHVTVRSPMYGEIVIQRINANTNSMPHSISASGEITAGYPPKP